jgi:hypothetical protein
MKQLLMLGLGGATVLALLVAGTAVFAPTAAARPVMPSGVSLDARTPDSELFADSLAMIAERDPFRVDRQPARRPYDPAAARNPIPTVEPLVLARPVLFVSGISWGRPPSALLEGVPATDGPRVVRSGDTLGGLTIRRISQERVTVSGYDTVWVLSLRQPWSIGMGPP